jgi:hypothetical protein
VPDVKLAHMTGAALLGLALLSMGWLFFLGGLAANYSALIKAFKSPAGAPARAFGPLPGVIGSITVFWSVAALVKSGVVIPWAWLWILLPLVIDPFCAGALVLRVLRK